MTVQYYLNRKSDYVKFKLHHYKQVFYFLGSGLMAAVGTFLFESAYRRYNWANASVVRRVTRCVTFDGDD